MRILVSGQRSYLYYCVVLCGQLKRHYLSEALDSRVRANALIREMEQTELLTNKKYGRARMERIKLPQTQPLIESMNGLDKYYMQITDDNNFKKTPTAFARRKERSSTIIWRMVQSGAQINGIRLECKAKTKKTEVPKASILRETDPGLSLLDSYGNPKTKDEKRKALISVMRDTEVYGDIYDVGVSHSERIKHNDTDGISYFNSYAVKKHTDDKEEENAPTLNINSSKAYGQIIGNENSYAVFYLDSEKEKFTDAVERRYRNYIEGMYLTAYGADMYHERQRISPKGECIIFYERPAVILGLIDVLCQEESKRVTPINLYSRAYLVNAKEGITNTILQKDWKRKIKRELFTISQTEDENNNFFLWCDAIINGVPAIEMISMDISKVLETKKLLLANERNKLIVICKAGDKEFLEEAYGDVRQQIDIQIA